MPDKITTDKEVAHALIERLSETLGPDGQIVRVGKTACGRTITGRTGWTAYNEGIDCRACKRVQERWTNEAPGLLGVW